MPPTTDLASAAALWLHCEDPSINADKYYVTLVNATPDGQFMTCSWFAAVADAFGKMQMKGIFPTFARAWARAKSVNAGKLKRGYVDITSSVYRGRCTITMLSQKLDASNACDLDGQPLNKLAATTSASPASSSAAAQRGPARRQRSMGISEG